MTPDPPPPTAPSRPGSSSPPSRPDWREIVIEAADADEETVAAALHASGSAGAWVAAPGEVRGYYGADVADPARAFAAAWRALEGSEPPEPTAVRRVVDEDWTERWRETVVPVRVAPGLWIAPPDAALREDAAGALVVRILPGLGFGTGGHPTTRALLAWLVAEPGAATVLDVGTGSGVLAIAAAGLGARLAVGLEIDPLALDNARGNVARNGAGDRVRLVRGSLDAVAPRARFDRVLANLDRPTLEAMLPDLVARCARVGRVGVAGVLESEREVVLDRARSSGLALVDEEVAIDAAAGDAWWSGWLAPEAA